MHIHVSVQSIEESTRFYSALFGVGPVVRHDDYAKWVLSDPNVNFAISTSVGRGIGLDHLGIQAESDDELQGLYRQLGDASVSTARQQGAQCCYAESDKHWATDPSGLTWEMFYTMNTIATYGADRASDVLTPTRSVG